MPEPLLRADAISKRFGGLQAVDHVSIDVMGGEIVSLIGPNGAGKTTCFAMLSGFLKADTGRIVFNGEDVTGLRPHEICQSGMVRTFQIVKPFANLSVKENIAVGAHAHIKSRAEALRHADRVADAVGMGDLIDKPAAALTVAGRKRLELARALATNAKLLLLDEVMAGLNASEIAEIVAALQGIRDQGVTILLIEHVMQAVMSLSDRTYVLGSGRIISEGTPRQVVSDPVVIDAYLGQGSAARMHKAFVHA